MADTALRMAIRTTASEARRARNRANARREILLAAAEVFARRGYADASLAELAEAGGYAAASLYRYFESKEEIFRELHALLQGELAATFALPVDRAQPLPERLAALLAHQFELAQRRSGLFAVLLNERPLLSGGAIDHVRAGLVLYVELLTGWLERHVSRAELRCSREDAARVIAAVVHTFHHLRLAAGGQPSGPGGVRPLLDLVLNGLQAHPAPTRLR
jgi:AcrR family transcriptional regulator